MRALPLDVPVRALGACSNLIIRDGGLRGVTIRLARGFSAIGVRPDGIVAGAAALDVTVAEHAAHAGLAGLEFLSGIPGTIGGAITMNAGAYGAEIADVLDWVEIVTRSGERVRLTGNELGFGYRHASLPAECVVIRARLRATPGDPSAIASRMAQIRASREATQPVRARTGGSTFRNPPDMKAWELIDAAGGRGLTRGGAQVSDEALQLPHQHGRRDGRGHRGIGRGSSPPRVRRLRRQPLVGNPPHRCSCGQAGDRHMTMRVAVLYGGISAEREVSLSSGSQVIAALREAGFDVQPIEVGHDLGAVIAALDPKPDVVFNALHGRFGEDGTIQGVLDWLEIPYTHSGVRASAMAMDKEAARAVFIAAGLPVARGRVVAPSELEVADPIARPYVVKPVNEGSSVGVEIIREGDNRRADIARNWRYNGAALVEEYIPGRELTVGVMGERALAVTEIVASHGFYDYESKYADGGSRHVVPARVHPETYARAMDIAVAAHRALGCRGASRADFRYDDTAGTPGRLVLLEVNTQPGLTPTSLLPEQAAHLGMSFPALCTWMVENAACRA